MNWKELIPNEVWWTEDFLNLEIYNDLMNILSQDARKEIDGRKRAHAIGETFYHYDLIKTNVRKNNVLIKEVFEKLNTLITSLGDPPIDYTQSLNELQFFAKCFSKDSRYALHTESRTMFGKYVFVNYLTDETSGELVFPNKETANDYLKVNLDNKKGWDETIESLKKEGNEVRYAGHLSITPKKNCCIVFTTGIAHWVEPVTNSKNILPRACLTGWVNASDSYMKWEQSLKN